MAKKKNSMPTEIPNPIPVAPPKAEYPKTVNPNAQAPNIAPNVSNFKVTGSPTSQNATSGAYNKSAGGYQTASGQVYPTTNPDFVPNPNATQIKFNKNGSVDYSPNGSQETISLSREEYNTAELNKGGNVTNKVQQVQQPQISQAQQQALNQDLTMEQQNRQVVPQEPLMEGVQTGAGALAGGLAGAGTGAAIGSFVPVVGTAIGGAIGGIIGAVGGAFTKISMDKRQDVKQAYTVYKSSKSNMEWVINEVNAGRMSPMRARDLYADSKANLLSAQRFLKSETSGELKRFLSEGSDELARVSDYVVRFPEMDAEFNNAVLNPNPMKVIYSQDILEQ